MQWHDVKYPSLCSHDFHKSLTNEIELPCQGNPNLVHRISQCGKICNKCTNIIKDSYKLAKQCLVCSDQLIQYVKDRELCQHDHPEFLDIIVKCLNDEKKNHEVPFSTKICKRCSDKLRAAFMNSKTCKVCEGKEEEVIRDMEKIYISSAYSHFKTIISVLRQKKAGEEVFKNEIQSACKSLPIIKRIDNPLIDKQLIASYETADAMENHQSKRYKLYPKCRKHKQSQICVCNNCLVALLNLDACPFGCVQEQKAQKVKVDKQTKISQTGFLHLYPLPISGKVYLQLFTIKLIQERGRMDRWESKISRISPKSEFQLKFTQNFPLFYSVVAIATNKFLISGGVVGPHISKMQQTAQSFVISLTEDLKQYFITQLPQMNEPRSGHSLVFQEQKKLVFAIGGLSSKGGFSKTTEVFSFEQQKWFSLNDLYIERSKPTAFCFKDHIYVMGGLTTNVNIYDAMAERFNFETQQWDKIVYDGYDYPFITNCTPSTSLPSFSNINNLFLFGGSNTVDMSNLVQPVDISQNKSQFRLNHLKILNQMQHQRLNPVLGLIKQDTLLCFGGLEECQHFLNVEGFTIKVSQQQLSIFASLDQISIGSYRLILREDSKLTYNRLYEQLERQGLIDHTKLSTHPDKSIAESHNSHLIEKLWYTMGKSFVWVPL